MATLLKNNGGGLVTVLLIFNILNVADFALTLQALAAGHSEANPVMGGLFATGALNAGLFKVATGLFVSSLIWLFRRYRLVLQTATAIVFFYLALIAYQVTGIMLI